MLRHPAARLKPLAAFFVSACGRQFYAISAGMSVSNRPQLPAQNIILETEKAISKRWNPQINWPFYGFIKEIKTCEIRGLGSVFAETKWKKTAL